MRWQTKGQSLVEMALILPILLMVIFGIVDLGYYVYGYATIYQAARNGSEKASQVPPTTDNVGDPSDPCTNAVLVATAQGAVLFPDIKNTVQISYPSSNLREVGQPVQVGIVYTIEPLTPLFKMVPLGNQGVMTVRVTARRSIESLGNNPNYENGLACN
jgi:hypothetical protein